MQNQPYITQATYLYDMQSIDMKLQELERKVDTLWKLVSTISQILVSTN